MWWGLALTSYGQNPFEVIARADGQRLRLWVLFSPSAFVQYPNFCRGEYLVEVLLLRARSVAYHLQRRFLGLSTPQEEPLGPNYLFWDLPKPPEAETYQVIIWDVARQRVFYEKGDLQAAQREWQVSFFPIGKGLSRNELAAEQLCLYRVAPGFYLVQAALYQGETTLPELTRYLSIEEQKLTVYGTGKWDTLRLRWRSEGLPKGAYLVGLFFYREDQLAYQALYPVRLR
ncbi:MAG: hypothetical protein ABDH91_07060 [Bacteroidia bacterium]